MDGEDIPTLLVFKISSWADPVALLIKMQVSCGPKSGSMLVCGPDCTFLTNKGLLVHHWNNSQAQSGFLGERAAHRDTMHPTPSNLVSYLLLYRTVGVR